MAFWSPSDALVAVVSGMDPTLRVATGLGLGVLALTALLMATTVVLRIRSILAERRRTAFVARWRPIMMEFLMGDTPTPRVAPRDWPTFMVLWNHLHEVMRGAANERLDLLGRQVGLDVAARRFLRRGGRRRQLMAVLTLGNLRDADAFPPLEALVTSPNAYASFAAARALAQIDPERAAAVVVPELARREDWAAPRVATFLNEPGAVAFVKPMLAALPGLPPAQAARLLRFLASMKASDVSPHAHGLLEGDEPQVLAAALPLAGPWDVARVRELVAHVDSGVRTRAAEALGRLGMPGDDRRLVMLLADPVWNVRYQAARALFELPFLPPGVIEALRSRAPVDEARDIVAHVLSERGAR